MTASLMPSSAATSRIGLERDDGRLRALETEALLADVARVQERLEDLGLVECAREFGAARRRSVVDVTPSTRS